MVAGSNPVGGTSLFPSAPQPRHYRTLYYGMGGAFRVIGGTDEGLYFRHTDHLSSTSAELRQTPRSKRRHLLELDSWNRIRHLPVNSR